MTAEAIVRSYDKDRYLADLFLPDGVRAHVLVLHALSAEVARVPSLVSEPQIGEIRLRWWVETLEAIARGEAQEHPLAQDLARVMEKHQLPVSALTQLVEARSFDLYQDGFPDVTSVESHFGETDAALFQLACMIVDETAARGATEACGLAGVAFGWARRHRDVRFQPEGLDVAAQIRKRLGEAERAVDALPRVLRPMFMPLSLVELYLRFEHPAQWRKQWRMWRAAR